ncbi:hypothetical protein GH741_17770 [Aquibacillus halophilus]|uniref:Uncharacterized protein n=1 Tax=Aquibacillus halophilus TaxID=930132 RepID=A0A6A8DJ49_9BACI|nr:DUF6612 family protein [Aquibacillus halophilus]MRH44496.1 hypothetical protein [Aquibacillus halophilus]
MKKLIVFLLMISIFLLAACNEDSTSNDDAENDSQMDVSQSEEASLESDDDEVEAAEEDTTEDEKESSDDEGDLVDALDVKSILKKSAEAMAEVTSFKGISKFIDDSTFNGVEEKSESTFTMEIILSDPAVMYAKASSVLSETEEGDMEMYMKDGTLYINSEENWFSMPTDSGYGSLYEQYNMYEEEQIEAYVNQSDSFEVIDNGDHYLLSFAGNNEEYKNVVMGSSFGATSELFKEHYENMKINSGTYEVSIDKETFYMTEYKYEYDSETTGELGAITQYSKGTYSLSDFNSIGEITVPEEVIENAQSMGESFVDMQILRGKSINITREIF